MEKQEVKIMTISKNEESTLQVSNLHMKYNEGKHNEVYVLKGIDMEIKAGQMVAIMGPSGCGKTTLLNLIGGLDKYTTGNIQINGSLLGDFSDNEITKFRRDNIGYIFQLFNLFEDQTALENVSLPLIMQRIEPSLALNRAKMMLQEVGLGDRFNDLPGKLSGGEQQKVAISRALITDPKIILADEPTGDLDTASSNDIMQLFRRMQQENQGMSIIIVTHSQDIANQCDRIIRIDDGKILNDQYFNTEEN
ncbi:MAG: ABC transporter ATP-binding protein [Candidatus Heimdallarchaeota archaeon]|nr:ABC transporter ATP-binding protein [Candidatus Heimdallarchaeota archaeon]MDH5644585.1 ABC transporter ATP-binding protein [Candidatus Heimdallarchaeota archaeon]